MILKLHPCSNASKSALLPPPAQPHCSGCRGEGLGGSGGRSHPKRTLKQGLAGLRVAGPQRPSLEPTAASLGSCWIAANCAEGAARAGMQGEKSRLGRGRDGGEEKGRIQGASPQPRAVCPSARREEEGGKGKLEGGDHTNALFGAKRKLTMSAGFPTEMPLMCPAIPKWATTARHRSSSQQAARQYTTATPKNQNQNKKDRSSFFPGRNRPW